jgi:hypothetical protein
VLVDVPLEQRPLLALLVDPCPGGWDLDLEEDMVRTMDALRPLLTVLTQVIIRTITENMKSKFLQSAY